MWDQIDAKLSLVATYWNAMAQAIKLSASDPAMKVASALAVQAYTECSEVATALWHDSEHLPVSYPWEINGSLPGLPSEVLTRFWRLAWFLFDLGELGGLQRSLDDILLPIPSDSQTDASLLGLNDSILFEDPATPEQKYYMPRYRVAGATSLGVTKYRIRLQTTSEFRGLTVYLESSPPAISLLDTGVRNADGVDEIRHDCFLFLVAGESVLPFDRITSEDGLLRAFLPANSLLDIHSLQQMISDPGQAARLIMRRVVEVEVPANAPRLAFLPVSAEERAAARLGLQTEIAQLSQQIQKLGTAADDHKQTTPYGVPTPIPEDTEPDEMRRLLRSKQRDLEGLDAQLMFVKWPFVFDDVLAPMPFAFPPKQFKYIYEAAH